MSDQAEDETSNNAPPPLSDLSADRPMLLTSREVLRGRREIWIQHGESIYRLRVTSSDKLYLSK